MINQDIKDSKAYKTYYDFATRKVPPRKARKYKKVSTPSRKLSLVKEAEPVKKAKRVKRPTKKSATAPTTSVVIRDTLGVSVSKKKAPAKGNRGKGIEFISNATLLKDAQVPNESEDKTTGTDEGTSTKSWVPDVPSYESDSDNESQGDSEDESDDINDDDDDDVMIRLTFKQSIFSSVSSDFASKFFILENVSPAVDEVASMMNVKSLQEESSTQAPSLFIVHVMAIPETATAHATTHSPTISMITPPPHLTTPSPAPTTVLTTTSIPAFLDFSSLFGFDQRVSTLEIELCQLKQADHYA
ncbi:hypothetical protein Tco_1332967 [Tanacetum coccineum]